MKVLFIRKTAMILGISIAIVSVIMFIFGEISYISGLVDVYKNSPQKVYLYNYIGGILSPMSFLISGFGYGGIIILLAQMFDPDKTISLSQKAETVEPENQTEDNIS